MPDEDTTNPDKDETLLDETKPDEDDEEPDETLPDEDFEPLVKRRASFKRPACSALEKASTHRKLKRTAAAANIEKADDAKEDDVDEDDSEEADEADAEESEEEAIAKRLSSHEPARPARPALPPLLFLSEM